MLEKEKEKKRPISAWNGKEEEEEEKHLCGVEWMVWRSALAPYVADS